MPTVSTKTIGGREFINFCGKHLIDARDFSSVEWMWIEGMVVHVWVVPHDEERKRKHINALWPIQFKGEEAKAILDWMNEPSSTEPFVGRGDWSKDRHAWVDCQTFEKIEEDVKKLREQQEVPSAVPDMEEASSRQLRRRSLLERFQRFMESDSRSVKFAVYDAMEVAFDVAGLAKRRGCTHSIDDSGLYHVIAKPSYEPVGVDTDGQVKPVDELSFMAPNGESKEKPFTISRYSKEDIGSMGVAEFCFSIPSDPTRRHMLNDDQVEALARNSGYREGTVREFVEKIAKRYGCTCFWSDWGIEVAIVKGAVIPQPPELEGAEEKIRILEELLWTGVEGMELFPTFELFVASPRKSGIIQRLDADLNREDIKTLAKDAGYTHYYHTRGMVHFLAKP